MADTPGRNKSIDELTAEMPQAVGANDGIGRMHVQLALSGEWQGAAR